MRTQDSEVRLTGKIMRLLDPVSTAAGIRILEYVLRRKQSQAEYAQVTMELPTNGGAGC